jgi:hypothetical protein
MEIIVYYFIIGFITAFVYSVISGIIDAHYLFRDFEFGLVVVSFFAWPAFIFCVFFAMLYKGSFYLTRAYYEQGECEDE